MVRGTAAAMAGVLACLIVGTTRTAATTSNLAQSPDFVAGCTLPFAPIADQHTIDHSCTIAGDLGEDGPNQAQNRTKNNFCATGTPVSATWNTFKKLQKKTDDLKTATAASATPFTFGSHNTLPTDRTPIRTAGFYTTTNEDDVHESTLVQAVAFLLHRRILQHGNRRGRQLRYSWCGIERHPPGVGENENRTG